MSESYKQGLIDQQERYRRFMMSKLQDREDRPVDDTSDAWLNRSLTSASPDLLFDPNA